MNDFDVVIVGTGASGVSAAFPLVEVGLAVMMIDPDDGGIAPRLSDRDYLSDRKSSADQWRWMFGTPRGLSDNREASSPKLRTPTLFRIFDKYSVVTGIESENFSTVGSLTSGGLTAAWGAGVATFSETDFNDFPIKKSDLAPYYRAIASRIGLTGGSHDDVSGHFGLDGLSGAPVTMDRLATYVAKRYVSRSEAFRRIGFAMGRARLAVLTTDTKDRRSCGELGLCLWGCPRRSIYSASYDLQALKRRTNLRHQSGVVIDDLESQDGQWKVSGFHRATGAPFNVKAQTVVLAAGVIASTRLAMKLSRCNDQRVRLLSTPTAAFALFIPALFGFSHEKGTGLAQQWYVLGAGESEVCGGLFPTRGLPVAEFVSRAPLTKRSGIDAMRWILPATSVGNVFFHSRYSANSIMLRADGKLSIEGGFSPDFDGHRARTAKQLRSVFRGLGGIAMPGSFSAGAPGSDAHYAGTLPMNVQPGPLQTDVNGALFGQPGVYIVDASALTSLPAKSHTLTVMANAARVGTLIAVELMSRTDRPTQ